mgnify:CR=1 FL=1
MKTPLRYAAVDLLPLRSNDSCPSLANIVKVTSSASYPNGDPSLKTNDCLALFKLNLNVFGFLSVTGCSPLELTPQRSVVLQKYVSPQSAKLAGLFSASNVIGFALTTLVVITLLTMSYSIRYWREDIGVELAYWGLALLAEKEGFEYRL